jgi:hypothetical protein
MYFSIVGINKTFVCTNKRIVGKNVKTFRPKNMVILTN